MNLAGFLDAVYRRAAEAAGAALFHESQQRQLAALLARPRQRALHSPLGDPLCTIYLICRAHGRAIDEQAEHVAAFCLFYLLSLDLFDDVQDDDLAGGPYQALGSALAVNDAITLGFLAQDQLRRAIALDTDPGRGASWLELACGIGLLAAAGQHRDLLGPEGALSPDQVIAMQQAKTSSVQLLSECGALLSGCGAEARAHYRALGEHLAVFIQIRDDLRDIYGKTVSPDLATGKVSYPLACFLERATEDDEVALDALRRQLPQSMPALRRLLYRSGAVRACAAALEQRRRAIHGIVATVQPESAALRTLLDVVDDLAEGVYAPPEIAATQALWHPSGDWHRRVRRARDRFVARMQRHGLPPAPALRPWHRPQWMYVPRKATIFYPDVEGLAEEVLPFQAMLLGTGDLEVARAAVEGQLATVLAHEMFHFWRDAAGRLSDDHWHEEWAANRLAVAYARRYAAPTLARTSALCERVIARFPERLDARAEAVLSRCARYQPGARGYGMDLLDTAVVHLEMVRRFIAEGPDLDACVRDLLAPALSAAG